MVEEVVVREVGEVVLEHELVDEEVVVKEVGVVVLAEEKVGWRRRRWHRSVCFRPGFEPWLWVTGFEVPRVSEG